MDRVLLFDNVTDELVADSANLPAGQIDSAFDMSLVAAMVLDDHEQRFIYMQGAGIDKLVASHPPGLRVHAALPDTPLRDLGESFPLPNVDGMNDEDSNKAMEEWHAAESKRVESLSKLPKLTKAQIKDLPLLGFLWANT